MEQHLIHHQLAQHTSHHLVSPESMGVQDIDSLVLTNPSATLSQNIPKVTTMASYPHFEDCDTNYPIKKDPIQNFVCNESEAHGFMDDTRKCLQDEKQRGIGPVERHLDCWGKAVKDAF